MRYGGEPWPGTWHLRAIRALTQQSSDPLRPMSTEDLETSVSLCPEDRPAKQLAHISMGVQMYMDGRNTLRDVSGLRLATPCPAAEWV